MQKLRKPVDVVKTGGPDIEASLSRGFDSALEGEQETESLLADFVAGMPELREDEEQPEKTPVTPAEPRKLEKPRPPANGHREAKPQEAMPSPAVAAVKSAFRGTPAAQELRKIGRYFIEQEIGKGASGSVYRARDPKLDRTVAIKTVRYRLGQPGADVISLKEKLYQEARAIAKLNHPHIVVIHDVDEDHDLCFIVMEYLDGTDLRTLIDRERRLEWERAVQLMIQACNALHYAHGMGILHLDIKPGNLVLLRHHGNLKVTDFSIDKSGQRPAVALHNPESATHLYLAPEQRQAGKVDLRADIFSLGVVFYELLTGETPCIDEYVDSPAQSITKKSYVPPSLQNIELPVELDEVIAGALHADPNDRYQSAEEFHQALVRLQTSVLLI